MYTYIFAFDEPVRVPVEGVIGGSACTHLGAEAKPSSPQTDTERFASL